MTGGKYLLGIFLDGLSASEKGNLVLKAMEFIHETGVIVTSITFDGAPVNIAMIEHLNADINNRLSMKTWFEHPVTHNKLFIFLDACHMLKLVRNCLGTYRQLVNGRGEIIDWVFIERLVILQEDEGLAMGTKIRQRHLDWKDQVMKVNLASQTFSKSVADALLCLEQDFNYPNFQGASATAEFITMMNDLFDILNSKNKFCKVALRKGISCENKEQVFQRLCQIKSYLYDLKLPNNVSVFNCRRKTGFVGFAVSIQSIMEYFQEFVEDKNYLDFMLTYKLSQDHIELF